MMPSWLMEAAMYTQRPSTRLVVNTLVVCAWTWMVLIPTGALAQSSVTGVVKDNPTGNWLNPLGVMTARTVKFTAQWDF